MLVISSAKIARTAFSFALSFRPGSSSDSETSPWTDEFGDGDRFVPSSPEARANGVDPLEPLAGNGVAILIGEDEPAEAPPESAGGAPGARETASEATPETGVADATDQGSTFGIRVEQLEFIRMSDAATIPTRAHDSDAGLDLYAAEGARIGPGERVGVGTGLAVAVPGGLAGIVLPRSGLALKHGVALVNSPGLIDPGYRGEVRVLLLNTDSSAEFKVAAGDRIAQLLLMPIAIASPQEAESLDDTVRGSGGFGSTG